MSIKINFKNILSDFFEDVSFSIQILAEMVIFARISFIQCTENPLTDRWLILFLLTLAAKTNEMTITG